MSKRVALSLVVGLTLTVSACAGTPVDPVEAPTSTAAVMPTTPASDPLADNVRATLDDIGKVWSTKGAPDVTLDFQGFTSHSTDAPTCNGEQLWATTTCFGGNRPVVYWERGQLAEALDKGAAMSPVIILAREYGRILLYSYGEPADGTLPALRAECFAGVYTAAAKTKYASNDDTYEAASQGSSDVPFASRRTAAFRSGEAAAARKDAFTACMKSDL